MTKRLVDPLSEIIRKDHRYPREAYEFVFEALEFTFEMIGKKRQVSGQELLEGIKKYAREKFGPLAPTVFHCWNVYKTDDFGEIVFRLVEAGLMSKTEEDSKEDFRNGFDFEKTFRTYFHRRDAPNAFGE